MSLLRVSATAPPVALGAAAVAPATEGVFCTVADGVALVEALPACDANPELPPALPLTAALDCPAATEVVVTIPALAADLALAMLLPLASKLLAILLIGSNSLLADAIAAAQSSADAVSACPGPMLAVQMDGSPGLQDQSRGQQYWLPGHATPPVVRTHSSAWRAKTLVLRLVSGLVGREARVSVVKRREKMVVVNGAIILKRCDVSISSAL